MNKENKELKKQAEEELRNNPINNFKCGHTDCEKLDEMGFEEFKHHLFNIHKIKSDQMKGKKQMVAHIDADYWYSYNYQWELETGLRFSQFIQKARAKNDPMRFEY